MGTYWVRKVYFEGPKKSFTPERFLLRADISLEIASEVMW